MKRAEAWKPTAELLKAFLELGEAKSPEDALVIFQTTLANAWEEGFAKASDEVRESLRNRVARNPYR